MSTKPAESIAISEFKATCLAVLDRVCRTGTSVLVTRRGVPVAEINPSSLATAGDNWLGSMRGTATIAGDIVTPPRPETGRCSTRETAPRYAHRAVSPARAGTSRARRACRAPCA